MKPIIKKTIYTIYTCVIVFCIAIIAIESVKSYNATVAFMANNTVGQSIPLGF